MRCFGRNRVEQKAKRILATWCLQGTQFLNTDNDVDNNSINFLLIYVLTQQPKCQIQANRQKDAHKQKTKQDNTYCWENIQLIRALTPTMMQGEEIYMYNNLQHY
jgi:hypothetical protein